MKITKIEILKVKKAGMTPVLCRVHTDEGIYGDGEVALGYGGVTDAAFGMVQNLANLLIGMDPMEHEVCWNRMYRNCFWGRNGGPIVFGGISALDIALWDIKGKVLNCPIYELLGGKHRSRLRAYASQLQNGWGEVRTPARSLDDYRRYSEEALKRGFDAVKIDFYMFDENGGRYDQSTQNCLLAPKIMNTLEARIAAVRETIGSKTDLILENHCYTDLQGAIQMGKMAKPYGIYYFEEPTTPHAELLAQVYQETGIPVASGERIYSRWQYNRCFRANALQIAQPDIGTCGGITEAKKICDLAWIYESDVQIHVCGSPIVTAASLQLEAAIPNFIIHEYNVNTELEDMFKLAKYNYAPEDGYYSIPDRPGIGNEISDLAYEISDVVTIG